MLKKTFRNIKSVCAKWRWKRLSTEKITDGTPAVSLEELLKNSDIVTLHCPLTKDNENDKCRKPWHDEKSQHFSSTLQEAVLWTKKALADALENEVIAGADIDVLTEWTDAWGIVLINAKRTALLPQYWAPKQTRERLLETVAQNLKMWIEGTYRIVNGK